MVMRLKILAETMAGDTLIAMAVRGERPKGRRKESHGAILSDLGINKTQSSRWRLGQLLAKIERGHGPGPGKKVASHLPSFFKAYIKKIGLTSTTATAAQRIGTLPAADLEKAFAEARAPCYIASGPS
jgi:hypothetical protein